MARWQRWWLMAAGLSLVIVWPLRWAVEGWPENLTAVVGGGAWPLHLLAELLVVVLCFWAAGAREGRMVRPAGLLALGALGYGSINGLSYGAHGDPWQVAVTVIKVATCVVTARALSGGGGGEVRRAPRWPGLLVGLTGLGMLVYWSLQLFTAGIMKDGLWSTEGDAYLVFHITAELLAGLVAVLGGNGLMAGRRAGVAVALVGGGGALYAAVNSAGWAVLHNPALGVIFAVCSLLVVLSAARLWRSWGGERPGVQRRSA